MSHYGTFNVEIDGRIARVTFNHPPINLLDMQMIREIDQLSQELEANTSIHVAVFQSADPDLFIAHADVDLIRQMPTDITERPTELNLYVAALERLRKLPIATIAKVAGIARGGGACLNLSAPRSKTVTSPNSLTSLKNGKPIGGLGNSEANWHSDMTYVEVPPPASILLGIGIPDEGGDTYFADQGAALESMSKELVDRLLCLSIKHDAAHTSIGKLRPGFEPFDDPRDAPGAEHPAIITHPETGKRALYLGRREWAFIPGLELAASEALLDEIWSYAAQSENVWRQQWQPFDLIIWDNRRVLHRRDDFDQNSRRLMKRCQVLNRSA